MVGVRSVSHYRAWELWLNSWTMQARARKKVFDAESRCAVQVQQRQTCTRSAVVDGLDVEETARRCGPELRAEKVG